MDLTNLKVILNRINRIQGMFASNTEANSASITGITSFDNILKEKLNTPFSGAVGAGSTLSALAISNPEKIITYNSFKMQAQTASKFQELEKLIVNEFPGKKIAITSTMDGRHADPGHPAGKAVDFVVEGITKNDSIKLEKLCTQAGFKPFNEYLYGSIYKTGDHMHISLL